MRSALLAVVAFVYATTIQAQELKMYIGTAEKHKTQYTRFFMSLIVCNNSEDTVYIEREDLDNLYPRVTNDVSIIDDRGSYFLVGNIPVLITDNDKLMELTKGAPPEVFDRTLSMEKKLYEENNQLPQVEVKEKKYYVFAPKKCLSINTMSQETKLELLKLHDVTEKEAEVATAHLTIPVTYYTAKDDTKRHKLLISRTSDDLKKCLLTAAKAGD